MEHERGGIVARIVGPVPVVQPRFRESRCGPVEERPDIDGRRVAGTGLLRHRRQSNRGAHGPRVTVGYLPP